jgi:hypothetical protein
VTRLSRAWRNLLERLLGRYYETDRVPTRMVQMVVTFANLHPQATRAEWTRFAALNAAEAYSIGYVRGLEWSERDVDRREPSVDPEALIAMAGYGDEWRDVAVELADPEDVVQQDRPDTSRREIEQYNIGLRADADARGFPPERR